MEKSPFFTLSYHVNNMIDVIQKHYINKETNADKIEAYKEILKLLKGWE